MIRPDKIYPMPSTPYVNFFGYLAQIHSVIWLCFVRLFGVNSFGCLAALNLSDNNK
jgi:hypothetical protein